MAAIALGRQGSFSSSGGSSDNGRGPLGPIPLSRSGHGQGNNNIGTAGLYGSTLTSLQYQPHQPSQLRRGSFMRNDSQQSGLGYGDNDDLSLVGECDVSSTRSREIRPGRRASLSAAIELTKSPPKRNSSAYASRPRTGRRGSFFGSGKASAAAAGGGSAAGSADSTSEALAKLSVKKSSRRASMAGYPMAQKLDVAAAEPATTPQFFGKSKKEKDRKKSGSFDGKNDPRAKKMLSKIKRPKGSRRASMSVAMGLKRSNSKGSVLSNQSNSQESQSNSYSEMDLSNEDNDIFYRKVPGRSASYGLERTKAVVAKDLGYGDNNDDLGYDPQLPPPPAPSKRAMQNRRGSTGMATGFRNNASAQKSLKESVQWKHQQNSDDPHSQSLSQQRQFSPMRRDREKPRASFVYSNTQSLLAQNNILNQQPQQHSHNPPHGLVTSRRGSAASQVSSTATDRASNVNNLYNTKSLLDTSDPDHHHHQNNQQQVPDGTIVYGTPQQNGRPTLDSSMFGTPTNSSLLLDSRSLHSKETPVQSNRKTRENLLDSQSALSIMGNVSSSLGGGLMLDNSDGSNERYGSQSYQHNDHNSSNKDDTPTSTPTGPRRGSRGLNTLPPQGASTSLGPPLGGGLGGGRRSSKQQRASVLGFNPYGSNLRDEEDDDEEEDLLEPSPIKKDQQNDDNGGGDDAPTKDGGSTSDENRKEADENAQNTALDTSAKTESTKEESVPTAKEGTVTTASTDGSTDFRKFLMDKKETTENKKKGKKKKKKKKGGDDDDSDHDSMTSEAPGEKTDLAGFETKKTVDVDEHLEDIEATGDWSAVASGIEAGDWSQGVSDAMLHQPTRTRKNSLLDRYPGSDYDDTDLGYGGKAMNAYDDDSERKDGAPDYEYENGYGPADLYDEDYSSFGWREHRARAAESMEFIDMEQLMSQAKHNKGLYLPTFIPAHGCTNASDFIVRCFVARLRAGMTVTKHSRSRFAKSHDRIIHILPTGYHITWIPETEEEVVAQSSKKAPTKLDLTKCTEVRHAWSRDPKSKKYTGTSTLRSKCKEGTANRSFALIYPKRTVDFTAQSVDQCKILMEGFSALCFRLQMAKLEQQAGDDGDTTQHTGIYGTDVDGDDSETASLTGTNMSAPWGL